MILPEQSREQGGTTGHAGTQLFCIQIGEEFPCSARSIMLGSANPLATALSEEAVMG
jgi:hypothetical protein